MLKKSITYKDFNDEEVTEDFYFYIGQAKLIEMQVAYPEGLNEFMMAAFRAEDKKQIYRIIQDFVLNSAGIKSPDGRKFISNERTREDFQSSAAYDALIMELVTDAEKAANFINGVIPQGLRQEAERLTKAQEVQRNVQARQGRPSHPQGHPSDSAAKPQTPNLEEHPEADPTAVEPDAGEAKRNVFESGSEPKQEVRILTQDEVREMDFPELKDGLATGRYKLQ